MMLDGRSWLDRTRCINCGICSEICRTDAIAICGREYTADEVMDEIATDEVFCRSGGGVTFSGGEPMLQPDFLLELLTRCKARGLHTAVDTAGNVPATAFSPELLARTDLFLYDVKAIDSEVHRKCTGSENARSLGNLRFLAREGKALWLRIPYISGMTCSQAEINAMADFIQNLNGIERIELAPYHAYGESKYLALGLLQNLPEGNPPAVEEVERVLMQFDRKGISITCPSYEKRFCNDTVDRT